MENKNLYSKKDVKNMLKAENLRTKKSLGQNFLTDKNVLLKTLDAANINENDYVLEIGPGPGVLTRMLAARAKKVVTVELDRDIITLLEKNTEEFSNVKIINADILKTDLAAIQRDEFGGKPFKVTANIPYYITTPIIMKLLESGLSISDIVVLVQKEVAERICAEPGTKQCGVITYTARFYAEPQIICLVPPEAFVPEPKVYSAVMHLALHEKPPVETDDKEYLFLLIKAAFSKRRKTFLNAISGESALGITKEEAKETLLELGFGDNIRGETLSLVQFAQISKFFKDKVRRKKR